MFVSVALTSMARSYDREWPTLATYGAKAIAFLLTCFVFFLIYRVIPGSPGGHRGGGRGPLWAGTCWEAAKYLFVINLTRANLPAVYGPLAFAVSLVLWAYVSSLVLVFGALMSPRAEPSAPPHRGISTPAGPRAAPAMVACLGEKRGSGRMAEGKLIVVSNRLPLSVRRGPEGWVAEPSSGGLASAVNPILKQRGGPVDRLARPRARAKRMRSARPCSRSGAQEHGFVAVDLPADLARRFYEGYANQTLWPLFHNFVDQLRRAIPRGGRPTSPPTAASATPSSSTSSPATRCGSTTTT